MPKIRTIRNAVFAAVAVFLTAAVFTGCGNDGKKYLNEGKKAYEERKYAAAVQYFTRAAELGNADAQYELGRCYEFGRGVEMNWKEASRWFHTAADQGHQEAQQMLAIQNRINNRLNKLNEEESRRKEAEKATVSGDSRNTEAKKTE